MLMMLFNNRIGAASPQVQKRRKQEACKSVNECFLPDFILSSASLKVFDLLIPIKCQHCYSRMESVSPHKVWLDPVTRT